MSTFSIIGFIIFITFYGSYFTKMFMQSKDGIRTDRMGKGNKPKRTYIIEVILKVSTFLTAGIQFISIVFIEKLFVFIHNDWLRYIGFIIASLGVVVFITAMMTMRDSWRAGVDKAQKTEMIKTGIYKYSRNPAFVGFDLFYIGLALAFSTGANLILACFSIIMLHFQILEEEKFLPEVFGEDYTNYKKKTGRYFGLR